MILLGEEGHGDSESFEGLHPSREDVSVVLSQAIDHGVFDLECTYVMKDFVMCNIYGRILSVKTGTSYNEVERTLSSSEWPMHSVTLHDDEESAAAYFANNVVATTWTPDVSKAATVDVRNRVKTVFAVRNRLSPDQEGCSSGYTQAELN